MQKLKTAIIGTGKVAHLHAAALKALPESSFTAVYNHHLPKAEEFAKTYQVTPYDNLEQLIKKEKPDAAIICTPHPAHSAPAIACANAGIHLLIEKPLASTLEDCDAILAAAQKTNIKLSTISQRRFYPPCQRIKDAIDQNKIGKPILGSITMYGWRDEAYYRSDPWRGTWNGEGGGVLVNQAPHQLDLLLWYMGEIAELFGFWANLNHPTIEVEDTAVASIRFQSGALGQILVTNSANPALYGRVQINGSNGSSIGVQTDGGAMFIAGMSKITEPPFNDVWTIPGEEHLKEQWRTEDTALFNTIDPTAHYHQLQIQDLLQAILENRNPLITGKDGRRTVELFTALYRSAKSHTALKFPLE